MELDYIAVCFEVSIERVNTKEGLIGLSLILSIIVL